MNEIEIKKHNFELAKNRLKEFSERKEAELAIDKVETDGGFLWLGDHKVTGYEFNNRMETVQNYLVDICSTNNKTIKEFREIYNALDALDKDYINCIVASVKAIEKTSNDVKIQQGVLSQHNSKLQEQQNKLDVHQGEIDKIVENIKKNVSALKLFKEKLDDFKHLTDIDKIWSDCKAIRNEIQVVSDSITKLSQKTNSEISAVNSQNKVMIEQVNQHISLLNNEIESLKDAFSKQSFNSIGKGLQNIDELVKNQSTMGEFATKNILVKFEKKIKYAYLIAGGSLGFSILELILIVAGVI